MKSILGPNKQGTIAYHSTVTEKQHSLLLLLLHRMDLHQSQLPGDRVLVRLVHRAVQNHLIHDVVHLLQVEHHLVLGNLRGMKGGYIQLGLHVTSKYDAHQL